MLDIGWTELLVVGVIALIVIGPKDLPMALRTFGKYVGRMRAMVRQFQDGIDDIARQDELREMQQALNKATSDNSIKKYLESDVEDAAKPTAPGTGGKADAASAIEASPSEASTPIASPSEADADLVIAETNPALADTASAESGSAEAAATDTALPTPGSTTDTEKPDPSRT